MKYPYIALASGIALNPDGRVTGKIPGIVPGHPTPEESKPAIWNQMIQHHTIHVGTMVEGWILPGLEVLHAEQRFQEEDFITLARDSPAVPPKREELFGKALFNGYEQNFATALHLLTPQIEHMVRYKLKYMGITTTKTNQQGIEDEKGLSEMIQTPEFEKIFGENSAFEI